MLAHKLREAMASNMETLRIGGHVRPENLAVDRIDRRLAENQSGKRQVVVVMRERGRRTLAQVFAAEEAAATAANRRIVKGTTVLADESPAWKPTARQLRHAAGQPSAWLQRGRRLHQLRGSLLLPPAPR